MRTAVPALLFYCLLAMLCPVARAQALPQGVALGMAETALRAVVPDVEKVRRPRRAPGGALGHWHIARAASGASFYDETFYFDTQGLQQVELVLQPQTPAELNADAFALQVAQLREVYGPELASRQAGPGFVQESASWASGDQDIIATRSGTPEAPTIRFVWRLRATRDASEL